MPELPEARRRRFVAQYAIPDYDAGVLTQSAGVADYFEEVAKGSGNAKATSNWVMGEVLRRLKGLEGAKSSAVIPLPSRSLVGLINLESRGTISNAIAKGVFTTMWDSGRSPEEIVESEGLAQIGDEAALLEIIRGVIAANADAVAQYRAGKMQTFGFLVGQVMKGSKGKANPKLANELLKSELAS